MPRKERRGSEGWVGVCRANRGGWCVSPSFSSGFHPSSGKDLGVGYVPNFRTPARPPRPEDVLTGALYKCAVETGGRIVWGSLKRQVGPGEASLPLPPTLTLAAIRSVRISGREGLEWDPSRRPGATARRRREQGVPPEPTAAHLLANSTQSTWPALHLTSTSYRLQAPPLDSYWLRDREKAGSWEWLPRLSISGAGTAGFEGWIWREPGEWGVTWTQPGGSRGREEKAPQGSLRPPLPDHRTILHCAFSRRAVMLWSVMQRGHSALPPVEVDVFQHCFR